VSDRGRSPASYRASFHTGGNTPPAPQIVIFRAGLSTDGATPARSAEPPCQQSLTVTNHRIRARTRLKDQHATGRHAAAGDLTGSAAAGLPRGSQPGTPGDRPRLYERSGSTLWAAVDEPPGGTCVRSSCSTPRTRDRALAAVARLARTWPSGGFPPGGPAVVTVALLVVAARAMPPRVHRTPNAGRSTVQAPGEGHMAPPSCHPIGGHDSVALDREC